MENIRKSDNNNMYEILCNYPNDLKKARELYKEIQFNEDYKFNNIVICGMGGSAIAGDFTASVVNYCMDACGKTPLVFVNREYCLPNFANEETLVILSSYSGNTEETLYSAREAITKTKNIICITTGGELLKFAKENNLFYILLPVGFQPRCALVYALIALLNIITKLGMVLTNEELQEKLIKIEARAIQTQKMYSDLSTENYALKLAKSLQDKMPVFYSEGKFLGALSLRWRQQIHENSKQICFGNVLPEMNHNEINSWNFPKNIIEQAQIVFFRDDVIEIDRMKLRFDAFTKILTDQGMKPIEIKSGEDSVVARLFDIIYLGDWVSYYLAMLNETDPTDIPFILYLKDYLGKN